jgi:DNA-binding transcriptional LysR family regulator
VSFNMLDNLRSMAVFACVVERGSFSGAARDLGITTSAVSQQIRSLEEEMDVLLLHRSTRKLSMTEAGQAFFISCQEMVAAAERGKIRINELRDAYRACIVVLVGSTSWFANSL